MIAVVHLLITEYTLERGDICILCDFNGCTEHIINIAVTWKH